MRRRGTRRVGRLLLLARLLLAGGAVAACGRGEAGAPPAEDPLDRFRAGLAPAAALEGGAGSREALVRGFFAALARSDTAALRRMELDRAEFAYLVYPTSPYTRPPYRQPPEIVWMLLRASGEKGLGRLRERAMGRPLRYLDHRCDAAPAVEGENRLWRGCVARFAMGADTASGRLFGVVVERGGRFKFASYDTDF